MTRSLITLVNDYHVNNKLKEIWVYVYYGSAVKNRPNNFDMIIWIEALPKYWHGHFFLRRQIPFFLHQSQILIYMIDYLLGFRLIFRNPNK